jgi:hypothetical protein
MPKDSSSLTAELKKITKGLTYQSESDYPVKPFFLKGDGKKSLAATEVAELSGKKPVKKIDFDEFFNPAISQEDWYGPEERKKAQQFQELVKTLKENLTDIKVYKSGKAKMDVYVIGKTADGAFAGISTTVVET